MAACAAEGAVDVRTAIHVRLEFVGAHALLQCEYALGVRLPQRTSRVSLRHVVLVGDWRGRRRSRSVSRRCGLAELDAWYGLRPVEDADRTPGCDRGGDVVVQAAPPFHFVEADVTCLVPALILEFLQIG